MDNQQEQVLDSSREQKHAAIVSIHKLLEVTLYTLYEFVIV